MISSKVFCPDDKIVVLPFVAAILIFWVKCKNAFILEPMQDRIISFYFWSMGKCKATCPFFNKKKIVSQFSAAILNFCVNVPWNMQGRVILAKFLVRRYVQMHLPIFQNNDPPYLAAILHFCVKCRNAFISETVQDRSLSAEFLAHSICMCICLFCQRIINQPFWWLYCIST